MIDYSRQPPPVHCDMCKKVLDPETLEAAMGLCYACLGQQHHMT